MSSVVLGLALLGGPAWAQEDPCAPDADGNVPQMCQSAPVSDTGTVDMEPDQGTDPCPAQPVDEDAPQVAPGEPEPGTDPEQEQEPVAEEPVSEEPVSEEPVEEPVADEAPGTITDDGTICAFSAPVDDTGGGGGPESAPVVDGAQLPRTGDRTVALAVLGAGLLAAGAGAAAAGRRRTA